MCTYIVFYITRKKEEPFVLRHLRNKKDSRSWRNVLWKCISRNHKSRRPCIAPSSLSSSKSFSPRRPSPSFKGGSSEFQLSIFSKTRYLLIKQGSQQFTLYSLIQTVMALKNISVFLIKGGKIIKKILEKNYRILKERIRGQ